MTAATIFSGGGGADIGLTGAGLDVLWGLEYDDGIASVARSNGLHVRTGDVTEVCPSSLEAPDLLHASPPCPNFSVAKTGAEETDEDTELAEATCEYICALSPRWVTLENVWGYRKSESWARIQRCLQRQGYRWNAWHLNAADYGVPQTRKRMIVAAEIGGPIPSKPTPTHAEDPPAAGLFADTLNEWVGWYEAVNDLVPDLPETELADWQKERLPDDISESRFVSSGNTWGLDALEAEPALTLQSGQSGYKAVLVATNTTDGDAPPTRDDAQPSLTQKPNDSGRLRAVLVHGQQTNPATSGDREDRTAITKDDQEPTFTINATSYKGTGRAVLVDPQQTSRDATQINHTDPAMSVQAWHGRRPSHAPVSVSRRVVQMTPRCLARFQTFPDWYELPDSKSLACRIIGNAVPPLLMKRIAASLVQ